MVEMGAAHRPTSQGEGAGERLARVWCGGLGRSHLAHASGPVPIAAKGPPRDGLRPPSNGAPATQSLDRLLDDKTRPQLSSMIDQELPSATLSPAADLPSALTGTKQTAVLATSGPRSEARPPAGTEAQGLRVLCFRETSSRPISQRRLGFIDRT